MGEIVNLRKVRKSKAREAEAAQAAANRERFGRTSAERDRDTREAEHAKRTLDSVRIEP